MNNLKVVFMGTADFSKTVLEGLVDLVDIKLVVCQPDRLKDKKNNLIIPSVKEYALKNNIEVFQPLKIRSDYQKIIDVKPDIIITCAYGQIIPKILIDLPKYGCINVHASLLPKYRGGAPIHHAIINGDEKTGITIMYMDEKMDEGDIITTQEIKIEENDNLETMFNKLSIIGRDLLIEILPSIVNNTNPRIKQDHEKASYAYNIKKEDEKIDFSKTNVQVHNLIRGLYPSPACYFMLENKRVKIYDSRLGLTKKYHQSGVIENIYKDGIGIGCGDGSEIIITELAIEGKKRMKVEEYLRGIDSKLLIDKKVN